MARPVRRLLRTAEFLAHAAGELDLLPAGSAIEQMLADYQVMRQQVKNANTCKDLH